MVTRTAIRRLVTGAAVMATLVAAAPAAAESDGYGNNLSMVPSACNPTQVALRVVTLIPADPNPLFVNGIAWLDYNGAPVAVSPPFKTQVGVFPRGAGGGPGAIWPWPSPSEIPAGQYKLHVLLQGTGLLSLLFTTVSATATVNPSGCPAVATDSTALATPVTRRTSAVQTWSTKRSPRSTVRSKQYPQARLCRSTVCVKRSPGAAWVPVARR